MDLIAGFSKSETERIRTHLNKLFRYLKPGGFVIVGGLAIRYHLLNHNIPYSQRPFNDLDIIVKNPSVVSPRVSQDLLIYHYHPQEFFLALVDPISKTKVDIFSYHPAPESTIKVPFGSTEIDIVSIEDQLVKTVFDIQRISLESKVDPKQFTDAHLLRQIASVDKADKLWKQNNFEKWPKSIAEAIERAEEISRKHPEWLQKKPFRKSKPYLCPNCQSADGFNIIPMEEIYKVLGYIE